MIEDVGQGRVGLVLLQMGGPGSPEQLGPFLRNLFSDPEMIRLPAWMQALQPALGKLYATYRVRKVAEEYEAIGWSDIVGTTRSLARKVEDPLDTEVAGVATAMRYTPPRARPTVRELEKAGAQAVLGVSLYPFYSYATTGSSIRDLEHALQEEGFDGPVSTIDRWGSHEGFIELTLAWIRRTLEEQLPDEAGQTTVLLAAHGIPQAYVEEGDPYPEEVRQAARQVQDRLGKRRPGELDRVELAFQSDVGPVKWLQPSVPDKIDELAADGTDTLVIVPFGFVSEHIETEYEIDVTYRRHALDAGVDHVLRVPAFDDHEAFAALIAQLACDQLGVRA